MIEINLLPEELRKPEGTPPARLLAVFLSVAVACSIGAVIVSYYVVKIPKKIDDIKTAKSEIESLEKRKLEVEEIQKQITELDEKVKALQNLELSRIRYARLLHKLCNVGQLDGVWFRTFNIQTDAEAALVPGISGGKRYSIQMTGYTTGATRLDMDKKLIELVARIKTEFEIAPGIHFLDPLKPPPADVGWCRFMNARFYPPDITNAVLVKLAAPMGFEPAVLKQMTIPKDGLDFQMTMKFEMPSLQ